MTFVFNSSRPLLRGRTRCCGCRAAVWRVSKCLPPPQVMVKKAGELAGVNLRPHDLRRHAATHASRSGTPIEIVSKVILRHAHLSMTQHYLGKVTDVEAMRWIENLYA